MTTRLLLALSLLAPAAAASAEPAAPATVVRVQAPAREARTPSLAAAGDFLVASQNTFGELKGTWSFEKGAGQAAPNAAGIVASALVALHQKAGGARTLQAARAFAEGRLADASKDRPLYDPDIEALVGIAGLPGMDAARYRTAARAAFEQRHGGANGREIVERLFMVRPGMASIVGYDAANALRAAVAVGELGKAREIVGALEATAARWNVSSEHGFQLTSRAALIEALAAAHLDSPLAATLRSQLLSSQGKDGSWGTRNTQATAYSVRALLATGDAAAAEKGLRFLRTTQLESGGWGTFHDYLPEPFVGETVYEVTAEVVLALLKA